MKKVFSNFKSAFKWYLNALETTSMMCPSCMIPPTGLTCIGKSKKRSVSNKRSKAA